MKRIVILVTQICDMSIELHNQTFLVLTLFGYIFDVYSNNCHVQQ